MIDAVVMGVSRRVAERLYATAAELEAARDELKAAIEGNLTGRRIAAVAHLDRSAREMRALGDQWVQRGEIGDDGWVAVDGVIRCGQTDEPIGYADEWERTGT